MQISAQQDLNNVGGSINAVNSLSARAAVALGAGALGGAVSSKPVVQNAVTEVTSAALKTIVEPSEKK